MQRCLVDLGKNLCHRLGETFPPSDGRYPMCFRVHYLCRPYMEVRTPIENCTPLQVLHGLDEVRLANAEVGCIRLLGPYHASSMNALPHWPMPSMVRYLCKVDRAMLWL